jgi:hypothetical protein
MYYSCLAFGVLCAIAGDGVMGVPIDLKMKGENGKGRYERELHADCCLAGSAQ